LGQTVGLTLGLPPGLTPGLTLGLPPGLTPGLTLGLTPGLTLGLTLGLTPTSDDSSVVQGMCPVVNSPRISQIALWQPRNTRSIV